MTTADDQTAHPAHESGPGVVTTRAASSDRSNPLGRPVTSHEHANTAPRHATEQRPPAGPHPVLPPVRRVPRGGRAGGGPARPDAGAPGRMTALAAAPFPCAAASSQHPAPNRDGWIVIVLLVLAAAAAL